MKFVSAIVITTVFLLTPLTLFGFGEPVYLEPWGKTYHQQFSDIRIKVISCGLLAPNAHNKQPWKIKLSKEDPSSFELYVETKRLLPATDPLHRQIIMSHGTFLELVNISAVEYGYIANIKLFPHGEYDPDNVIESMETLPLAKVTLKKSKKVSKSLLFTEIFERVTNRTSYEGPPLTENEITALQNINNDPDLKLVFIQEDIAVLKKIRELAIEGVRVESTTQRTVEESEDVWRDSEEEKNEYRYGLTMASGTSGLHLSWMEFLSRTFPMDWKQFGQIWLKNEIPNINRAPSFTMIISKGNSRSIQVKAGMLYARVQLKASQMGINMQPESQTLQEYPEMAEYYREIHTLFAPQGDTIQLLVRTGRASNKVMHSLRKDVMDIMVPAE